MMQIVRSLALPQNDASAGSPTANDKVNNSNRAIYFTVSQITFQNSLLICHILAFIPIEIERVYPETLSLTLTQVGILASEVGYDKYKQASLKYL